MTDTATLFSLLSKLSHPIHKIRVRALENVVSKLDSGIIKHADLLKYPPILTHLLEWFNKDELDHEDQILGIIHQIIEQTTSGGHTLLNLGAINFFQAYRANIDDPKQQYMVDNILNELFVLTPSELPILQQTIPTNSFPHLTLKKEDTIDVKVNRLLGKNNILRPSSNVPIFTNTNLPSLPFFPHFQNIELSHQDEQLLLEVSVKIQMNDVGVAVSVLNQVLETVLEDFPPEIFLQRCDILRDVIELIAAGDDGVDGLSVECLRKWFSKMRESLKFHNDQEYQRQVVSPAKEDPGIKVKHNENQTSTIFPQKTNNTTQTTLTTVCHWIFLKALPITKDSDKICMIFPLLYDILPFLRDYSSESKNPLPNQNSEKNRFREYFNLVYEVVCKHSPYNNSTQTLLPFVVYASYMMKMWTFDDVSEMLTIPFKTIFKSVLRNELVKETRAEWVSEMAAFEKIFMTEETFDIPPLLIFDQVISECIKNIISATTHDSFIQALRKAEEFVFIEPNIVGNFIQHTRFLESLCSFLGAPIGTQEDERALSFLLKFLTKLITSSKGGVFGESVVISSDNCKILFVSATRLVPLLEKQNDESVISFPYTPLNQNAKFWKEKMRGDVLSFIANSVEYLEKNNFKTDELITGTLLVSIIIEQYIKKIDKETLLSLHCLLSLLSNTTTYEAIRKSSILSRSLYNSLVSLFVQSKTPTSTFQASSTFKHTLSCIKLLSDVLLVKSNENLEINTMEDSDNEVNNSNDNNSKAFSEVFSTVSIFNIKKMAEWLLIQLDKKEPIIKTLSIGILCDIWVSRGINLDQKYLDKILDCVTNSEEYYIVRQQGLLFLTHFTHDTHTSSKELYLLQRSLPSLVRLLNNTTAPPSFFYPLTFILRNFCNNNNFTQNSNSENNEALAEKPSQHLSKIIFSEAAIVSLLNLLDLNSPIFNSPQKGKWKEISKNNAIVTKWIEENWILTQHPFIAGILENVVELIRIFIYDDPQISEYFAQCSPLIVSLSKLEISFEKNKKNNLEFQKSAALLINNLLHNVTPSTRDVLMKDIWTKELAEGICKILDPSKPLDMRIAGCFALSSMLHFTKGDNLIILENYGSKMCSNLLPLFTTNIPPALPQNSNFDTPPFTVNNNNNNNNNTSDNTHQKNEPKKSKNALFVYPLDIVIHTLGNLLSHSVSAKKTALNLGLLRNILKSINELHSFIVLNTLPTSHPQHTNNRHSENLSNLQNFLSLLQNFLFNSLEVKEVAVNCGLSDILYTLLNYSTSQNNKNQIILHDVLKVVQNFSVHCDKAKLSLVKNAGDSVAQKIVDIIKNPKSKIDTFVQACKCLQCMVSVIEVRALLQKNQLGVDIIEILKKNLVNKQDHSMKKIQCILDLLISWTESIDSQHYFMKIKGFLDLVMDLCDIADDSLGNAISLKLKTNPNQKVFIDNQRFRIQSLLLLRNICSHSDSKPIMSERTLNILIKCLSGNYGKETQYYSTTVVWSLVHNSQRIVAKIKREGLVEILTQIEVEIITKINGERNSFSKSVKEENDDDDEFLQKTLSNIKVIQQLLHFNT